MSHQRVLVALSALAVLAAVVRAARGRRAALSRRVAPYRPGAPADGGPATGSSWSPSPTARRGLDARRWLRRVPSGQLQASERTRARSGRIAEQLRAAGLDRVDVDAFRVRQLVHTGLAAGGGVVLGALLLHSAVLCLALAGTGAAVGYTRGPARLARMAEDRRLLMRLELVTIDQVLAIHVRAGAGPVQAISRVVERGHGVVVDELRAVLVSIRAGRSEAEAFRNAARSTTEPHAARTYRLFALAAEHGADLGVALRALSDDLRDVRRDELRRQATRRRAAMLVPTIAVLAPIMLLFVIAPLPSIVLGGR